MTKLSLNRAAQVFQMLGDESRLQILILLKERGEVCVSDLTEALGQSQPATSHHLSLLRMSGLVRFRRNGKSNLYRIDSEHARDLIGVVKA